MNKVIFCRLMFVFIFFNALLGAELLTSLELRTAAFIPSSKLSRKIYGNVGAYYEIEAATNWNRPWKTWLNYSQFSKRGKADGNGSCDKTSMNIYNVSLGINYIYSFRNYFEAYLGLGSSFFCVNIKNKSCCSSNKESKPGAGLVFKSGLMYYFSRNYFIDVFADYLYQPTHFRHRCVDIGGLKIGIGIGRSF